MCLYYFYFHLVGSSFNATLASSHCSMHCQQKKGEKEFATVTFQEIHFKMRIMNYGKVPAEDMVHNISSEIEEGLW